MKNTIKAALVGGAAAAALAAALSGAGSANASCASLNGHDIGQGCKSTARQRLVGLGRDAQADSAGPGNVAIAVGNPGYNRFYNTDRPTLAYAHGTGNTSVALGDGSTGGHAGHTVTRAFVLGKAPTPSPTAVRQCACHPDLGLQPSSHNTSVTVGDRSEAGAVGSHHRLSTAFGNDRQRQNNGLGG